jgi:dGTPase
MREFGGFEHNEQSVRAVDLLEEVYPDFRGLNLTYEVREGLNKHGAREGRPTLEADIANLADEITYYSHDLDDAIDFEILAFDQLEEVEVWRVSHAQVARRHPRVREPDLHKLIIREIIDLEVRDLVSSSAKAIEATGVKSVDDVRKQPESLIRSTDETRAANQELRRFLYKNVYYHPRVAEVNRQACEMLRVVFQTYMENPESLGDAATRRIETEGLPRTVCDYIAGMTDRYLIEEYKRITR